MRLMKQNSRLHAQQEKVVISSDGVTVWVNGLTSLLGRFGRFGIDIHIPLEQQREKGECLFCTHVETTAEDWLQFVAKMQELHGVTVSERYRPYRFRQ